MGVETVLAEAARALLVLACKHAARSHLDVLAEVTVPVGTRLLSVGC